MEETKSLRGRIKMNKVAVVPKNYLFRLNAAEVISEGRDLAFILGPLIGRTRAQGAVVYRADEEMREFRAIAARADAAPRNPEVRTALGVEASGVIHQVQELFQTEPEKDERFSGLPEVLQYGFRQILLFPLRSEGRLLGILTLGRTEAEPFDLRNLHYVKSIARVVGAVLERDVLQTQLANRKLMERAKGIIQRRRRVSEEEAYLSLRLQSRRMRIPMADLARGIINEAELRKTA
jgi:GAF domain-containing protein